MLPSWLSANSPVMILSAEAAEFLHRYTALRIKKWLADYFICKPFFI